MHDGAAGTDVPADAPPADDPDSDAPSTEAAAPRRTALLVMLFVLALLIVAGIVWTVVSAVDRHPDRDASGVIIEAGSLSVAELRVGDCFQQDPDPTVVMVAQFIQAVPCDQPHDAEVYAENELGVPEGAPYPGQEQVFEDADELCVADFEQFIGTPAATSALGIYRFIPSEATWPEGDRRVVCAVYDPSGAALTGSLEGTRR